MSDKREFTCANCPCWAEHHENSETGPEFGDCRFYAPRPRPVSEYAGAVTVSSYWCWQHPGMPHNGGFKL